MSRWIGDPRREILAFGLALAALVAGFFGDSLLGGKVLSPADILFVSASFRDVNGPDYEPLNRLLMDPVLQFQPWLEFNRREIRAGRLPLWNPSAGCGTPHLANGQAAVFDPFHAIAYLGRLPDAHAPMAAARLWMAGLGMFLLARHWGLGRWGRWFAGLVYPFSGFLVVWLLYPVTSVAVWFPWVLWASDRVLDRPSGRRIGLMALFVGFGLLGGHVQTSAHVLLAAGLNGLGRWRSSRGRAGWLVGMTLGIALAAVEIVPLAEYLTKSPVWTDRAAERKSPLAIARPRVLDMVCNALPYAFGSQRRGHPNLARGLGVHNLNESAGGFAGLATVLWLAPLAWSARSRPRVRWLFGLTTFGLLASYRWPPFDNVLRAIPVLNVTDNRRLSLWVAFGLSLLGGVGLDHLGATRRGRGWALWPRCWVALAFACAIVAVGVGRFEAKLSAMARAHYDRAARETPGADPATYRTRADRQTRDTLRFLPRYYGLASAHLAGLAAWAFAVRRRRTLPSGMARSGLLAITLVDLFGFGLGLNPAIDRRDDRPVTPLIDFLLRVAPPPRRVLGVGEELPPNVAMRYGLADVRNYDSIELAASVDSFAALYPPGPGERTSRREVTWAGVIRARDRLREAGVAAIVAATPPPEGAFDRVEKIGAVWVALPEPGPFARLVVGEEATGRLAMERPEPGRFAFTLGPPEGTVWGGADIDLSVHETSDGNWSIPSRYAPGFAEPGPRIHAPGVTVFQGEIAYEPASWYVAASVSMGAVIGLFFALRRPDSA